MAIKLTATEARDAGYKQADAITISTVKDSGKGTYIDNPQPNYICYIGPCEPGTGARLVCYHSDSGCDDCWLEPDPQCD